MRWLLATYPDATVVWGASERDPESPTHITNPSVLVEVLSPSTEDYDRGEKLEHEKQIPSLGSIVLFSHDRSEVTLWQRHEDGWNARSFGTGQTLPLEKIGATLDIDRVYASAREARAGRWGEVRHEFLGSSSWDGVDPSARSRGAWRTFGRLLFAPGAD